MNDKPQTRSRPKRAGNPRPAFKKPVVIEPGLIGRFRIVRGPEDALDALRGRWPMPLGEEHGKALAACEDAMKGRLAPHRARTSFVAAARAARILVTDETARRYSIGSVDAADLAA